MSKNLIVELLVEELPPKALKQLGESFATNLLLGLRRRNLAAADSVVTGYATPRRLAAHITGVLANAPDQALVTKLMPTAVGLDAGNKPTPALTKKAASNPRCAQAVARWPEMGDDGGQLYVESDGKTDVLFFRELAPGADIRAGLQRALDEAINGLPIPKVMSYQLEQGCELPGWSSVSFIRPAHGLVALHGTALVPVTALGLAATGKTRGHRFEAKVETITLRDADSYAQQLRDEGAVIANFNERRSEIVRQLADAAAGLATVDAPRADGDPDVKPPAALLSAPRPALRPIEDAALLDEVTALVERPNVLVCAFEPEYLEVPQECLILTMKANQKYFPLVDANGKLTHRFLVVSNITADDPSAVIAGNERVVRPRLADAKFFFDQDRKKSLASRVDALTKVVYHNKLG
ncbi:MAG: glycine--tRNA ligase subunit beta, partial [Variovorax sp.]